MTEAQEERRLQVAVVTGHHPFDVIALHDLWTSFPQFDVYVQHMEDYVTDVARMREHYDVVVFYNFHQVTPGLETDWWEKDTKTALEQLGVSGQGIMILHHALLAYKQWAWWTDLVGVEDRSFGYYMNQQMHVHIEKPDHPILAGLSDFDLTDETYTMGNAEDEKGNTVLLTVDHPNSMRTLAWTRQHCNARVFCWQSGHDGTAFSNPAFNQIMHNAIRWLAGNTN